MTRKFAKPDYTATSNVSISLGEAIAANHLARFVVDLVAELDLSAIYKRYGVRGGEAIAPEALLALLCYGYSTGKFSSRKIEKATYEDLGFRFVAGVFSTWSKKCGWRMVLGLPRFQLEMHALDLARSRTLFTRLLLKVQKDLPAKYAM